MEKYRHFVQKYEKFAPYEAPYSYAKYATIGCGGYAKIAFFPERVDSLIALLRALDDEGEDYTVLGALSNVLPPDGESDGIVVSTKRLHGVTFEDGAFALAGTTAGGFLTACKRAKKTGGEFLTGIPCTIGGAAYMNAGAAGVYLDEILSDVLVYEDGALQKIPKAKCEYAYKHSVFMERKATIVGAYFRLEEGTDEEIEARLLYFNERRKHLPRGRSMGCVFKNPKGAFAGELIERAGLKGKRVGGAFVSTEHANFILNEGGNSSDVKRLIDEIKKRVFDKLGIVLEEEIRYL